MEEILIEEKRYVSSKQAAKITGYAKDYIGQLCREGRVPARLVGRSWYVLESAIQDHRFGNQNIELQPEANRKEIASEKPMPTWEFPRYEPVEVKTLPSVNRLREEMASDTEKSIHEEVVEAPQAIHDSWKEWFDHVAEAAPHVEADVAASAEDSIPAEVELAETPVETAEEFTNIPVRVMGESLPRREFLPREVQVEEGPVRRDISRAEKRTSSSMVGAIQMMGALIAVVAIALAGIGTGYFDQYLGSIGQVEMISGVVMYNK